MADSESDFKPFIKIDGDIKIPKEPHLAVCTGVSPVEFTSIPRGACLLYIEDPNHLDGVMPLILLNVNKRRWEFHCGCMKPECTRTLYMNIVYKGTHPSSYTYTGKQK